MAGQRYLKEMQEHEAGIIREVYKKRDTNRVVICLCPSFFVITFVLSDINTT